MKVRTTIAALAAVGLAAVAVPAAAQADEIGVTLDNGGAGTRTLSVEDMAGNKLTNFDFGDSHAQPFRVRVQDTAMTPTGFSVGAQMTNLYRDASGTLSPTDPIASANLRIDPATNPLDVAGVVAKVQPVVDVALSPADATLCTLISAVGSCDVSLTNLAAKAQSVTLPVDLGALNNLPLVPQASGNGAFTAPTYTTASPDKPGSPPAATSIQLLAGSANLATPLLATLTTQTQTAISTLPLTSIVDQSTLIAAVRGVLPALGDSNITALLGSDATVTVKQLVQSQVLSLTGTYTSFPILQVSVPPAAPKGTYKGTLVVTGVG